MKDVEIGAITAPVGLRGEVRVKSYAEDPSRFSKVRRVELRRNDSGSAGASLHGPGSDSREAAPSAKVDRLKPGAGSVRPEPGAGSEFEIEKVRMASGMVVLKFKGVDDRDAAEKLRSYEIFMDAADLEPLPEGEHYIRNLIGLEVVSADSGEHLGTVGDVLTDRPQDIYVVVKDDGSEFMVPGVPEFIREISEEHGIIKVSLIEGMC